MKTYNVMCWNVDGLRAEIIPYIKYMLVIHNLDILCLNETKKPEDKLHKILNQFTKYEHVINVHKPAGYHGVAILIKQGIKYELLDLPFNCKPRNDNKSGDARAGRLLGIRVDDKFNLITAYVPNSGVNPACPLKNLSYRIDCWDPALFELLNSLDDVIFVSDINVALQDIDVSHPSIMRNSAGFTDIERDSFNTFLENSNYIDIYRQQHPDVKGYTFRGYRGYSLRWRLDNCLVTESLVENVIDSYIETVCKAKTDHLPFGVIVRI